MDDSDQDIRPNFSLRNLAPPREPQGYLGIISDTITNTYNQFPAVSDIITQNPQYKVTGVYLNNSVYTQKEVSRKQSGIDESLEDSKAQHSAFEFLDLEKKEHSPEIIQEETNNDSFVIIDEKERKPSFETFLEYNIEVYNDFIQ